MPLHLSAELPSYAFTFTPAEIPRGQVYEFVLNHVMHVEGWAGTRPHEMVDRGQPGRQGDGPCLR